METKKTISLFVIWTIASTALAHEGGHHALHETEVKKQNAKINASYEKNVKLIFQMKCMVCHASSQVSYPFYYHWPWVHQLIERDISEAKKHISMDKGFPFGEHGTPQEDLETIKKTTQEGSMPPFRYRIMHWGSGLIESEKKIIIQWVDESLRVLQRK